MKFLELLIPLLGVLLGAAITGVATVWKTHQARKKIIARALAELLEVRHHVNGFSVIVLELRKHVTLPADFIPVLRKIVDDLMPIDGESHRRYDDAVSVLAELDPVLAFQLRSKNRVPELLALVTTLAPKSGLSTSDVEQLDSSLQQLALPQLDKSVLQLAGAHSWRTKRSVLTLLTNSTEVPPELADWVEQVKRLSKGTIG